MAVTIESVLRVSITRKISRMYAPIESTALFQSLEDRQDLYAKILELRTRVGAYLQAVGTSFSHFTSHAIDHSDAIVRELSALLYEEQAKGRLTTVQLNCTEIYMLLVSVYLHDAGMVVSEKEKFDILSSADWATAKADPQVADDMKRFENQLPIDTPDQEIFVNALEQKLLFAAFFRKKHAERAHGAINGALRIQDDFLAGDPSATATVSAICVGHGLSRQELASATSYPTRRDHFGEPVDVRFLAVLLRIGDLLDMRYQRACPLMRSIASPLPASSEPHWSQYRRITSRMTSPERIEVRAECQTADEHRLLLDWCEWLVEELTHAPRLLASGTRHGGWKPPLATVGGPADTIEIRRAPNAKYRADTWKFRFDENEIVLRLVRDVHRGQFGFLRELIQNALDTTRARALMASDKEILYPQELPQDLRQKFPVVVSLEGDKGAVTTIVVVDQGLGMTADIIKDYFLQIGRSWYKSQEFTREFSYSPTSRFGIGFLSVFAVADRVTVSTRWHSDPEDGALSMDLLGPKSHLLLEDAVRSTPGTSVIVHLREPMSAQAIVEFLESTCVANEFDVIVQANIDGSTEEYTFPPKSPVVQKPLIVFDCLEQADHIATGEKRNTIEARLETIRVDLATEGVNGFIDFLAVDSEVEGEDWSHTDAELEARVTRLNPLVETPRLPPSWTAVNGLTSARGFSWPGGVKSIRWQLDVRTADAAGEGGLDRQNMDDSRQWLRNKLPAALDAHLLASRRPFPYAAKVQNRFRDLLPDWSKTVPILQTLEGSLLSINEAKGAGSVLISLNPLEIGGHRSREERVAARQEAIGEVSSFMRQAGRSNAVVLTAPLGFMKDESLEELVLHLAGPILEVSKNMILVELGTVRTASRRPSAHWLEGESGSDLVVFTFGINSAVINVTHPLVIEIRSIPKEHKAARTRLLRALTGGIYSFDLRDELLRLGRALGNETFAGYASLLGRKPEVLRLPVLLQASEPES